MNEIGVLKFDYTLFSPIIDLFIVFGKQPNDTILEVAQQCKKKTK